MTTPRPIILPKEHIFTVTQKDILAPSIVHLTATSETPIPFLPGQYASFLIGPNRRPFSFACLPGSTTVEFIIGYTEQGVTKPFIEPLSIGDTFKALAPYGQFMVREEDPRPLLFIAGGTGIAPIYSQLKHAFEIGLSQPMLLYFASRTKERIYFQEKFAEFEKQHANFSFRPSLSEADSAWPGRQGLVTTGIPEEISNLSDYTAYVCGAPQFVIDSMAMLKNNGVPKEQIHFERFT